jgi:carbon monoxide dehydrogenase subunit G
MKLEQNFTVPVPVEQAWEVLLDLHRVAPCMPGATLTSVEGDEFTGNVKVKLGPIMLTYNGKGRFVERDEAARRVVIEASGRDTRSAGTAAATVTAQLVGEGDQTRVDVLTDLSITGKPAQFGRSMISDVSTKLLGQFADCLAGRLAEAAAGRWGRGRWSHCGADTRVPPTPARPPRAAPTPQAPRYRQCPPGGPDGDSRGAGRGGSRRPVQGRGQHRRRAQGGGRRAGCGAARRARLGRRARIPPLSAALVLR